MLRAIIIDDEQNGINSLKLLLEKHIKDVKVVAETTLSSNAIELIEDFRPEIVFLDVNMPGLNGFQVLEKLVFKKFNLIFTTAHSEYALRAIKNNAVDYLLKPIDIEDLQAAMEKVRKNKNSYKPIDFAEVISQYNRGDKTKIPINTKGEVEYIDIKNILRIHADSNYSTVYILPGERIVVSKTLKEFESLLCSGEYNFMRVHQSHIINLNYVVKYFKENTGNIIMKDNSHVPLSKNKKDDFIKWLGIS